MANGSSALQLVETGSPATPVSEQASKPDISIEIGEAVAAACTALCCAVLGHRQEGQLDPVVKDVFAGRIAAVVVLQLGHGSGDEDFVCRARRGGRARLRRYFADEADADAAIDICISELLGIRKSGGQRRAYLASGVGKLSAGRVPNCTFQLYTAPP